MGVSGFYVDVVELVSLAQWEGGHTCCRGSSEAFVLGHDGCQKEYLPPFQALALVVLLTLIGPFPSASPAACWVLAGLLGQL